MNDPMFSSVTSPWGVPAVAIKTTTFAALVAATRSTLMGLDTVVIRRGHLRQVCCGPWSHPGLALAVCCRLLMALVGWGWTGQTKRRWHTLHLPRQTFTHLGLRHRRP